MRIVLKVAKKALPSAFIYFAIFLVLLIVFSQNAGKERETVFRASEMNLVIQDEDAGVLSGALCTYLSRDNKISGEMDEALLSEMLFYGKTDYVLFIKDGFEEGFLAGNTDTLLERQSIKANVAFLDQKIELFFRYVRAELATGKSMEEACRAVLSLCERQAGTAFTEGAEGSSEMAAGYYFFTYLSYILPCVLIMVLGPILHAFYKKDIKMRTDCGTVSARRQNLRIIGGISLVALLFWGLLILLGALLYRKDFTVVSFCFGAGNSFLLLLVSVAISSTVGIFVRGDDALNGASNLISMGMAFLCGVFVPGELLPDYVHKIAEFLPVSWYMKNVKLLFEEGCVIEKSDTFFKNGAVIFSFAVAFFFIALASVKKRKAV